MWLCRRWIPAWNIRLRSLIYVKQNIPFYGVRIPVQNTIFFSSNFCFETDLNLQCCVFYLIFLNSARGVTTFDSTTTTVANQLISVRSVCLYVCAINCANLAYIRFIFRLCIFRVQLRKHFFCAILRLSQSERKYRERKKKE